jgi:hypothetical protein
MAELNKSVQENLFLLSLGLYSDGEESKKKIFPAEKLELS